MSYSYVFNAPTFIRLILRGLVVFTLVFGVTSCGDKSMEFPEKSTDTQGGGGSAGSPGGGAGGSAGGQGSEIVNSGIEYPDFNSYSQNEPMINIIQREIFDRKCATCHAAQTPRLTSANQSASSLEKKSTNDTSRYLAHSGFPGPEKSVLIAMLVPDSEHRPSSVRAKRMPLSGIGGYLSDEEILLLQLWIEASGYRRADDKNELDREVTIPQALDLVK